MENIGFENGFRNLKILYSIIVTILAIIMFYFVFTKDKKNVNGFKNESFNGAILQKKPDDYKGNHERLILDNGYKVSPMFYHGLYDFVHSGDTLVKKKNELYIKVKRNGKSYIFNNTYINAK